jgi:hypothetical protein
MISKETPDSPLHPIRGADSYSIASTLRVDGLLSVSTDLRRLFSGKDVGSQQVAFKDCTDGRFSLTICIGVDSESPADLFEVLEISDFRIVPSDSLPESRFVPFTFGHLTILSDTFLC